jgi:hypothetical protein
MFDLFFIFVDVGMIFLHSKFPLQIVYVDLSQSTSNDINDLYKNHIIICSYNVLFDLAL